MVPFIELGSDYEPSYSKARSEFQNASQAAICDQFTSQMKMECILQSAAIRVHAARLGRSWRRNIQKSMEFMGWHGQTPIAAHWKALSPQNVPKNILSLPRSEWPKARCEEHVFYSCSMCSIPFIRSRLLRCGPCSWATPAFRLQHP